MRFKIFISSVQNELNNERKAVKEYIENQPILKDYFSVYLFEKSPANVKSSKETYLSEIENSTSLLS